MLIDHLFHEANQETLMMYHGTALANVANILRHGLLPSGRADATTDRWATLGGVYLTNDFDYAVRAAANKYPDQKIAVVVVEVNTRNAIPDEDVVEKALIAAFTKALDLWGIDDAYRADLDAYAYAEENHPLDWDEKPFDRTLFFKEFWQSVMSNMSVIAGTPRRRDPELVATAVGLAVELADKDLASYIDLSKWQAIKTQLVALYPRLRSSEQWNKTDLKIAHNIRLTKPVARNRIARVLTQDEHGSWLSLAK